MAFRSPETCTPASIVPRSTVFTSLAARMMALTRRPPAPSWGEDFPGASVFGVAAAADAGVPSPSSFVQAVIARRAAATSAAGGRRNDAMDTRGMTGNVSEKERRDAWEGAESEALARVPDRRPRCTDRRWTVLRWSGRRGAGAGLRRHRAACRARARIAARPGDRLLPLHARCPAARRTRT